MSEAPEMSSAGTELPVNVEELDSVALSALLSSRVCHDLINPVGAIGSGLEVLGDDEMDGAMRDAAMDLIKSGAEKAIALLTYARLAYGAAGGYGAQISLAEAHKVLGGIYEHAKADLHWSLGDALAPKENVKVLLILGLAAADSVPRGGDVKIEGDIDAFSICATGKRLMLQNDLVRALKGDAGDIAPKFTPALIASKIVGEVGGSIDVDQTDEAITFRALFS